MRIFVDGFLFTGGGGYTVVKDDGSPPVRVTLARYLTSNEAELRAVMAGVEMAQSGDEVITDSKVVWYWVRAGYCKARADLSPLAATTRTTIIHKQLRLLWGPREVNQAGWVNEKQPIKKVQAQ